ncbi:MAG: glycosyltransferase family 2 protein [Pirellula sp.]
MRVAVVIPCYRVASHLPGILSRIGPEISAIYCVVDGCTQGSRYEAERAGSNDPRIQVLVHETNQGVGQAFITGYQQATADGADIVVKLDGDGQMAPEDIPRLIKPLLSGQADYVKGNRFYYLSDLRSMPTVRMLGNAGLSFLSKLSSGYWNLFDPTNGFLAIHTSVGYNLRWEKVHRRYFFESDLLFHLYSIRAVVCDVPIGAHYGDEKSNLHIGQASLQFPFFHLWNFAKRIVYCYFLRDFNIASLYLLVSLLLMGFGTSFGLIHWVRGYELNQLASAGTVMFAALPIILGWQSMLAFFSFDVGNVPTRPLQGLFHLTRRER